MTLAKPRPEEEAVLAPAPDVEKGGWKGSCGSRVCSSEATARSLAPRADAAACHAGGWAGRRVGGSRVRAQ